MPTLLVLLVVLCGRAVAAITRGLGDVLWLPMRTAAAVAPHTRHARWWLAAGAALSLALCAGALVGLRAIAR